MNAALGYVAGLGVPLLPSLLRGNLDVLREEFLGSPLQIATGFIVGSTIFTYSVIQPWLSRRVAADTLDLRLLRVFNKFVDPVLLQPEVVCEGIAWGQGQTFLPCPTPNRGWATDKVRLHRQPGEYTFESSRSPPCS